MTSIFDLTRKRDGIKTTDKQALEAHPDDLATFWTHTPEAVCAALRCGSDGLSSAEAESKLARYGPNSDAQTKAAGVWQAVLRRLLEPLSLILLAAGFVSLATGDAIGGGIIVAILSLSIGLDTLQEGHAVKAAEVLRHSVALKAEVKRDGAFVAVEVEKVVPGDILRVRAGDIIPADALILEDGLYCRRSGPDR